MSGMFIVKNMEVVDEYGQECVYNEFDGFWTVTYEGKDWTLTIKFHHHRACVDGTLAWLDVGDRQYEFYNFDDNGGWKPQQGEEEL